MVKPSALISSLLTVASIAAAAPATTPVDHSYHLQARDVTCRDDLPESSLALTSEAVECINYLASLGDQACVASVSGTSFCRRGETQITGLSRLDRGRETSSPCQKVARAAGRILDLCSRGDGKVRGANEAWDNGNLLVDIRRVQ